MSGKDGGLPLREKLPLALIGSLRHGDLPGTPGKYDFAMRALLSIGNTQKRENP